MVKKNLFLRFLTGDVEKDWLLTRIVPLAIMIFVITALISNLMFPSVYDWRYMVISDLTNEEANPQGFLILSLGISFLGVIIIPLPGFIHRRLKLICRGTSTLGTFFFILGIIGFIFMGIIYEGTPGIPSRTHENLAAVGFLGMLIGIFWWGWPMIKDELPRYNGKNQFNKKLQILGAVLLWFAVLGMGSAALYLEVVDNNWGWVGIEWVEMGISPLLSFALWEWLLVIFLLIYLPMLVMMIPVEVQPLEPIQREK